VKLRRKLLPLALLAAGLIGMGLFSIAERSHLSIVPTGDFARGLCLGICFGLELLGVILLLKPKAGPEA
jgi:hypothetical protein